MLTFLLTLLVSGNNLSAAVGTIDILVNNAGILSTFSWDEFDDAKVKRIFDINVDAEIQKTLKKLELSSD